jgi:SAM-dependent methyltransferase
VDPSLPDEGLTASRWDEEYRRGRYADEPPLPFVATIAAVLKERGHDTAEGLYVGCGNGRNYLPLVDAGLSLCGLDVSREALAGLARRRPTVASRLVHADFRGFEPGRRFAYLIAIQVFQHGAAGDARTYFDTVATLLRPGGLFFLRVNSSSTQIRRAHTLVERSAPGGLTIRYDEGPKRGLLVHFYSRGELERLAARAFVPVGEPREDVIQRAPPETGSWSQWEMIWSRR